VGVLFLGRDFVHECSISDARFYPNDGKFLPCLFELTKTKSSACARTSQLYVRMIAAPLAPRAEGLTTYHVVKAIAESSRAEGVVLRAVGFVLMLSTVPDLHSHSWASGLWPHYATGDNRRTYIFLFQCLFCD